MNTDPRIITLTGTVHPKAEIQSVDAANGVATFRWLDANGAPVDSGGSIARFTPLAPLPADPEEPNAPVQYPEVTDAVLKSAIENPPVQPAPVPASVTRRQLLLELNARGITRTAIRTQLGNDEAALIEFDEASEFARAHPLVGSLATALGLTSAQVDDVFRSAANR